MLVLVGRWLPLTTLHFCNVTVCTGNCAGGPSVTSHNQEGWTITMARIHSMRNDVRMAIRCFTNRTSPGQMTWIACKDGSDNCAVASN